MATIELSRNIKWKFQNQYPSVVVRFNDGKTNFQKDTGDWMPTNEEVLQIIRCRFQYENMRYNPKINPKFKGAKFLLDAIMEIYREEMAKLETPVQSTL